jgi:hypothetical protein
MVVKKNNVSGGVFNPPKGGRDIFYNTSEHIEKTHTRVILDAVAKAADRGVVKRSK